MAIDANSLHSHIVSSVSMYYQQFLNDLFWFRNFGFLWHINSCWLLKVKSCFYKYIRHMFWLILAVKWSNSSISNNSIQHKSTKLNASKYCNISLIIQLIIIFYCFSNIFDLEWYNRIRVQGMGEIELLDN